MCSAFLMENKIKYLIVISDDIKPCELFIINDGCDAFGFNMK